MNIIKKICNWYFSRWTLPYWCILAMDCVAVFMSGLTIYYMKYGGLELAQHFWQLTLGLGICLFAFIVAFFAFHTFRGVMRYASFVDLSRIAYSNIAAGVFVCLAHQVEVKMGLSDVLLTPRFESAILIFILATSLMWGLRVIVKTLHDTFRGDDSVQKVFIYGCMQGGVALAKSIRTQEPLRFRLRGFISGDKSLEGSWLLGEQVYYDDDSVVELMKEQNVTTILVSPLQTENFTRRTSLIDALIAADIKIRMMPQSEEWDGKSDISHNLLKEVEIEDLLPREKIEVDMVAIGSMLRDKRILITGAAGSIGSEMARQVAKFAPSELILIDQAETPMHDMRLWMKEYFGLKGSNGLNGSKGLKGSDGTPSNSSNPSNQSDNSSNPSNFSNQENNLSNSSNPSNQENTTSVETIVASITDQKHMEKIFSEHKPEYVFHAAAYKHVPMMEDNPGQAVRNNIYGTRVIADLAVKYGTKKFVMISTDKAVNPTNVMGCSKRICEIYCQALNAEVQKGLKGLKGLIGLKGSENNLSNSSNFSNSLNQENNSSNPSNQSDNPSTPQTRFITTRFGNVLGSNGSVIPIFREQIRKGGPVKVTHPEIIRYFMLIPEACRLVLEAGTMGNGGEIYVFDMGEPVKIVDLAQRMINLSGAKNVKIEFMGLRDGEKLYEELLATKENTKPSNHPKIMVAEVREYPYDLALKNEVELYELSKGFDDMAIVKKMKEIVPEYKSQHSKYEVLDR